MGGINFELEMGRRVKSEVTGFTGTIISRSECLYGCNRYYVQPQASAEGALIEGAWIDEMELEYVDDTTLAKKKKPKKGGGLPSRDR